MILPCCSGPTIALLGNIMTKISSIAALLVLASVSISYAEAPVPSASAASRFSVEGTVGVNSPLGVGVEFDAAVTSWLTFGAGVGKRFVFLGGPYGTGSVDADTQLGAMARAHLPVSSKVALGGGFGVSMGRYVNQDLPTAIDYDDLQEWASAKWANAEVYAKTRGKLYVRGFVGASALLNPNDCINYFDTACKQDTPLGKIYVGVGVGYNF